MVLATPNLNSFLQHLRADRSELVLHRSMNAPQWNDEVTHRAIHESDPVRYALCSLMPGALPAQQAKVLYLTLASSWANLDQDERHALNRSVDVLVSRLQPAQVIKVFLSLRRARANHKHVTHVIANYVLNHPQLELLARKRRPAIADCLEHALGKDVARGCARLLSENGIENAYVQQNLMRVADNPERVADAILYLFGHRNELSVPENQTALAPMVVPQTSDEIDARPRTVTATNRGDVAATLVHQYRGGSNENLQESLTKYVQNAAERLPQFEGRVALILDASGSTMGYGERQFCCVAQSQALRLVLEQSCTELNVIPVGGTEALPMPEGDTDLAGALLDALEIDPDVIAIVSDGYENVYEGDLARVIATLPKVGIEVPVVFCHSKFTNLDDLTLRRPAPQLPEVEFWHENDFADVLWTLFASARSPKAESFVDQQLWQRLNQCEKEMPLWISS